MVSRDIHCVHRGNRVCRFARDSALEGDGFEPSVPVAREPVYIAEGELRRDRRAAKKIWRGTDGSNPSPSSAESATNLVAAGGVARGWDSRVRIRFAPAESLRTIGSGTMQADRKGWTLLSSAAWILDSRFTLYPNLPEPLSKLDAVPVGVVDFRC